MTFLSYLWEKLAHIIFKKRVLATKRKVQALLEIVGDKMDDLRAEIYQARLDLLLAKATGEGLDRHGRNRKLYRQSGESDEDYLDRLLGAWDYYGMTGTLNLYAVALHMYLSSGFLIDQAYELFEAYETDDPRPNWNEFAFIVDDVIHPTITEAEHRVLKQAMNKYKPSHTRGQVGYCQFQCDDTGSLVDRDLLTV